MNDIDQAQSSLDRVICQRIDDCLNDSYGGYVDSHTFDEIGSHLAGALESEGVRPEDVSKVIQRNGFSHFDRGVAYGLATEAIGVARGRNGMQHV